MSKLLVVDDDFEQRDLYAELFRENGFEVLQANDGESGMKTAVEQKPDLLFTGIMMPKMNGFDLIKSVRSHGGGQLPVIMFSHLGRMEDREKAESLGVLFMVKGQDSPAKILKETRRLIEEAQSVKAGKGSTPEELKRILERLQASKSS